MFRACARGGRGQGSVELQRGGKRSDASFPSTWFPPAFSDPLIRSKKQKSYNRANIRHLFVKSVCQMSFFDQQGQTRERRRTAYSESTSPGCSSRDSDSVTSDSERVDFRRVAPRYGTVELKEDREKEDERQQTSEDR